MSTLYVSGRLVGMAQQRFRQILLNHGYIKSSTRQAERFLNLSHDCPVDVDAVLLQQEETGLRVTLEVNTDYGHPAQDAQIYFQAFMRDVLREEMIDTDILAEYCNKKIKSVRAYFDRSSSVEVAILSTGLLLLATYMFAPAITSLDFVGQFHSALLYAAIFMLGCSITKVYTRKRLKATFLSVYKSIAMRQRIAGSIAAVVMAAVPVLLTYNYGDPSDFELAYQERVAQGSLYLVDSDESSF